MIHTYATADMHFGHTNIIKFEDRPFENIEQMDKTIINNWNRTVKRLDKIFIAGDISFYNQEKTNEILSKLNGYKVLVLGNHDRSPNFWKVAIYNGWLNEISKNPIIYKNYIISHYPIECVPEGYINIHGHIHGKKLNCERYINSDKYINCGVDVNNFKPMRLE